MTPDGPRPGHLVVEAAADGAVAGGLMVTDADGLPLDFRYTDPIAPTRLQRVLYGGALDRYLRGDVVAGTLLAALDAAPTVLIVGDESLLTVPAATCPVALVEASRLPAIGAPGTVRPDGPASRLVQADDGSPLRVTLADPAREAEVVAALVALAERGDPLEPADRVRAALSLIASGAAA